MAPEKSMIKGYYKKINSNIELENLINYERN